MLKGSTGINYVCLLSGFALAQLKVSLQILPFAVTQMDLEGIMLSEISQTEKDSTLYYHLYVGSKK